MMHSKRIERAEGREGGVSGFICLFNSTIFSEIFKSIRF